MRIQDAMSELLAAMGFDRMAQEVKLEEELDRLRLYAKMIVKNAPSDKRVILANKFRLCRPALY
jgi:hypothetical protein